MNDADTVTVYGQAQWNGTRWDSIGHRIQEGAQQTYWFLRFENELYACGGFGFYTDSQEFNKSLAKFDGANSRWESLECINPNMGGMTTLVPKEPTTTLYATGYTGSICGYPQSCIFRYDGSAFHIWEPFNEVPYYNNNYVGTVFDYQGYTYVTGLFRDPLGPGSVSFMRHNGSNWEYIPGWNTLSPIKSVLIRNGILYVAGAFHESGGAPGNLVAAFNGTTWNNLGGGLEYSTGPNSAAALDLEWWHGELYACGLFNNCGGVLCDGIAKWTGTQWCGLPGQFSGATSDITTLSDMTIWQDSLFVCGGISYVDGVPFNRTVAQWIGGDEVAYCSEPVGVVENANALEPNGLEVRPIGNGCQWLIQLPPIGSWKVDVYDASGRMVQNLPLGSFSVLLDLGQQASGMYIVRATNADGKFQSAKVAKP